jgi:hypothetical protein
VLRICVEDGCETLTFGPLCLEHEPPAEPRLFPRGRPYRLLDREVSADGRRIEQAWPLAEQSSLRSFSPS